MMKSVILLLGLLIVAGCTTPGQREARCKCFNSDGTASGLCKFEPLAPPPAVFSFMGAASAVSTNRTPRLQLRSHINASGSEICGA